MIIGLGFRARSGKDTVANYLVNNYQFVQESFAFPLKEYIGRNICGFTDKQLWGSWKEIVDPEWGKTPRQMLQLIGTEAMRNTVHKDFWIIPMRRKLKEHIKNGRNVVTSDLRFFNELSLIKEFGGITIRIDREKADIISSPKHESELELETNTDWDYVLDNNHTLEQLYDGIKTIMENVSE